MLRLLPGILSVSILPSWLIRFNVFQIFLKHKVVCIKTIHQTACNSMNCISLEYDFRSCPGVQYKKIITNLLALNNTWRTCLNWTTGRVRQMRATSPKRIVSHMMPHHMHTEIDSSATGDLTTPNWAREPQEASPHRI